MKANILYIEHQEFGPEEFRVSEVTYNVYDAVDPEEYDEEDEDEEIPDIHEFVVNLKTSEVLVEAKGLEGYGAKPNFEATALLTSETATLTAGQTVTQEQGYDFERDENLSLMYYFNHQSMEHLVIEVHEVEEDRILMTLTAEVLINGSNGSQPDASVKAKVWAQRDSELVRSFT